MPGITASVPAGVQGLPQPSDNFSRRFRNRGPLILRQIIDPKVLNQWAQDPEHVAQALNNSVQEQKQKEEGFDAAVSLLSITESETLREPLLPVMVAEDTKNFMDNPQFTKKIAMTAREIVTRVLVRPSSSISCDAGSDIYADNNSTKETSAQTAVTTTSSVCICPLCENNHALDSDSDLDPHDSFIRFYYRGHVPPSLYTALQIPALLDSLSLPSDTTPFASAPNKSLMRIWISLAGATTPLHYDRCHGILMQLVGRKRFVVFSHEDTNNLYAYDSIAGPGHASKVRGLGHCFPFVSSSSDKAQELYQQQQQQQQERKHLDENLSEVLERWPKIKYTDPWVIDLEPGDALYTPPGFWHEVTSVDNSISITVPWDMDASELEHVPRHMAF